jgi:hypothetical protein
LTGALVFAGNGLEDNRQAALGWFFVKPNFAVFILERPDVK